MPEPKFILIGVAAVAFLASALASVVALVRFAQRGEPLLGFAFHRYYWGADARRVPCCVLDVGRRALGGIAVILVAALFR